ncbi:MAG: glycoside hydrolase family 3 protein [Treponema sp.]|nr:glycoside hydrolase family 3 protein [Treponema sp.]
MMKKVFSFLLCILFFSPVIHLSAFETDDSLIDSCLEEYLDSLPEEQAISQIFLVNIQGNKDYSAVEVTSDGKPLVPGGALFFAYNLGDTIEESIDFISSIEKYCDSHSILRPYLAVDQEGGLVNRLRSLSNTLPSAQKISEVLTPSQAYELYSIQARQMRAIGFDMNLAPVAESLNEENMEFLDTRSFGNVPQSIVYSMAAVNAYQANGINAVLKHFPGNTSVDPHTGLPEIDYDSKRIDSEFIIPLRFILSSNPSSVLMSHARVPAVDSSPACLSNVWVTEKLKNQLGFTGLVISDDIFMAALAENGYPPDKAAVQAIEAGVHVIMLSEKLFGKVAENLLENASKDREFNLKLRNAEKKVLEFKLKSGILKILDVSGKKTIVPSTMKEQLGSVEERIETFNKAKKQGNEYYKKYFLGK